MGFFRYQGVLLGTLLISGALIAACGSGYPRSEEDDQDDDGGNGGSGGDDQGNGGSGGDDQGSGGSGGASGSGSTGTGGAPPVACGCAVYITDPTGCTKFTSGSEDLYNAYRGCVCSDKACGTGSVGAECADNACAATPMAATPDCDTCTTSVGMVGGACTDEFYACAGDV